MKDKFNPERGSHPGKTLEQLLQEHQITQAELAKLTSQHPTKISRIIIGKAGITSELAQQLEKIFHAPAQSWNKLQSDYDNWKLEQKLMELVDEGQQLDGE